MLRKRERECLMVQIRQPSSSPPPPPRISIQFSRIFLSRRRRGRRHAIHCAHIIVVLSARISRNNWPEQAI